jgi:hypothetical protein
MISDESELSTKARTALRFADLAAWSIWFALVATALWSSSSTNCKSVQSSLVPLPNTLFVFMILPAFSSYAWLLGRGIWRYLDEARRLQARDTTLKPSVAPVILPTLIVVASMIAALAVGYLLCGQARA